MRGRRAKRAQADAADPEPVMISRATAVSAQGFESEKDAMRWLDHRRADQRERERSTEAALQVINRAIRGHRLAAADPYVNEVTRAQADRVRIGYGTGDDVVEGRWRSAYMLPAPRSRTRRQEMLAPQEELAQIMSGRGQTYASEDLALRARLDLDQRRPAQAALQLQAALAALAAELQDQGPRPAGGLRSVNVVLGRRGNVNELAAVALKGRLDPDQTAALADILTEVERTLRRRRYGASAG
jgi:hypothetical protein